MYWEVVIWALLSDYVCDIASLISGSCLVPSASPHDKLCMMNTITQNNSTWISHL